MRDWCAFVREKLTGLDLAPPQQEETVRELAAHLEDHYEEGRALGLTDSKACDLALSEVANWRRLARKIHHLKRTEETMKGRIRNLWLPGFISGSVALESFHILWLAGYRPRPFWAGSLEGLQLYLPWLFILPLFGALAAHLSRRAEGQRLTRLAAVLSPSIVTLVMLCVAVLVSVVIAPEKRVIDLIPYLLGVHQSLPVGFAQSIFNWVVLPSAALLLGAIPFLRNPQIREEGAAQ